MMTNRLGQADNLRGRSPISPSYTGEEAPDAALSLNPRIRREINSTVKDPEVMPLVNTKMPPLATQDDNDDDNGSVSRSHINDIFFGNTQTELPHSDGETISKNSEEGEIPDISSRAGEPEATNGEVVPKAAGADDVDASGKAPLPERPRIFPGRFPFATGFGTDIETGTFADLESIPDVNVYQHKKTLAQGMMDLALFSANANQLRYVLESYSRHPYYYPSVVMIAISLMFQVAVGVGLIWNATYNVKDEKEICIANKINNFTIIGIFLVTVINVFISAFGVAGPPTTGT